METREQHRRWRSAGRFVVVAALLLCCGSAALRAGKAPCDSEWYRFEPDAGDQCVPLSVRERQLAVLVRDGTGGEAEVLAELAAVGAPEFEVSEDRFLVYYGLFYVPNASAAPAMVLFLERPYEARPVFDIVTDAAARFAERFWTPMMDVRSVDLQLDPSDSALETPHQRVIVLFDGATSMERMQAVIQEEAPGASLEAFGSLGLGPRQVFVTPGLSSGFDVLELANRLHLREEVDWAIPQPLFWLLEGPTAFNPGGGGVAPVQVPIGWPGLALLIAVLGLLGWRLLAR